jgi:hypothetical protein
MQDMKYIKSWRGRDNVTEPGNFFPSAKIQRTGFDVFLKYQINLTSISHTVIKNCFLDNGKPQRQAGAALFRQPIQPQPAAPIA